MLLLSLQSLLCDPTALDAASPANVEAARLMATDRAAFDAHLASAHFQSFNSLTTDWVVSKQVQSFERV